jgi:hypothetical protein
LHEELPLDLSALEFMMQAFPDVTEKEDMRRIIGRYGLTGREQVILCDYCLSYRLFRVSDPE